jgi:hypothetical protein
VANQLSQPAEIRLFRGSAIRMTAMKTRARERMLWRKYMFGKSAKKQSDSISQASDELPSSVFMFSRFRFESHRHTLTVACGMDIQMY